MKELPSHTLSPISTPLIQWYEQNKRELPWRETKNPYLIWISEIILQQTRVAQGYEYYLRFIHRFPDVKTLAEAQEDDVMKYWEGLGYYSRARNLHTAAQTIMTNFGGKFPTTHAHVLSLKGIGEYTAAAICSFAFGLPHAVVDGNVYRVLSRLFAIATPIDSTIGKKEFALLANELLDRTHPDIYNQALMELGALQCTPRSPQCITCPLSHKCLAHAQQEVANFPVKEGKIVVKPLYFNYLHIIHQNNTWINKRSENDIWKNLYEFPLIESESDIEFGRLTKLEAYRNLTLECGKIELCFSHPVIKHVLSHRVIYARFYTLAIETPSTALAHLLCIPQEKISDFAFARLTNIYLERNG